ncbi:hypothetical protein GCM10022206_01610 [Streptomyces chiangmaiensis]
MAAEGARRTFRRTGYASVKDAQTDLDRIRAILDLAGDDEDGTELGEWLHPDVVSKTFRRIARAADLPTINLRDLRHVSATVQHAGSGDLHSIKETLRHSTITLTSDTYTSLLPEVDKEIAERAAALVPRARRSDVAAPVE